MKKFIILALVFFSVSSFVSASNVDVSFTIGGCSFNFEGDTYVVARDSCATGSRYGDGSGHFYCQGDGSGGTVNWYTLQDSGVGCSMGIAYNTFDLTADPSCCPSGYYCGDDGSGYICEQMTGTCEEQESQGDCGQWGPSVCTWLNDECAPTSELYDIGCPYYENENDCNNDEYNLASSNELVGSQVECEDISFTYSDELTQCVWNETACGLKTTLTETYVPGGEAAATTFSCTSSCELGECVDGNQAVDCVATADGTGSFSSGVPEACLEAIGGCDSDSLSRTRFCGEASIKLSGFSFVSVGLFVFMISFFYYFKGKLRKL